MPKKNKRKKGDFEKIYEMLQSNVYSKFIEKMRYESDKRRPSNENNKSEDTQ